MKPDWDKLIREFNPTAKYGFVGDVDCTAEGKPLCDANGVKGYPTIKYGDPNALEDYKGGRDYDSLLKFSKETVDKPICSPANMDPCSDEQRAEIEKIQAMDSKELDDEIKKKEKEISDAEKHFDKKVKKLQKKYEKLQKNKESTIEAVKASGLALMKSVRAAQKSADKTEL